MKKSIHGFLLLMSLCLLAQVDIEPRGNSPNARSFSRDCTPLRITATEIDHSSTITIQLPSLPSFQSWIGGITQTTT